MFALLASADTIILRDGASYTGQFAGGDTIRFVGARGVQYTFPSRDVQSMMFNSASDTIALRDGKTYSGHYAGADPIAFNGSDGVGYQFPVRDLDGLVLTRSSAPPAPAPTGGTAKVIPEGSDITIRTDESIDSKTSRTGQLYAATIADDVADASGNIAIPRGSRAQLVIRDISTGGAVHTPELILDLFSVTVGGKEYRVVSSNVAESGREGVGANRRTAEFGGGGAAFGALLGGIFGGGKGAGIGAAAGAGGGVLTQIFTRGKQVTVPVESVMTFRLYRTLVLRPR